MKVNTLLNIHINSFCIYIWRENKLNECNLIKIVSVLIMCFMKINLQINGGENVHK